MTASPATVSRSAKAHRRAPLRKISFGGTSAVVTSIGLVVAFGSAARGALVAGLLVVGIADNLTDSLGVHLYQEAEGLEPHSAFVATACNFVTRLAITGVFIALGALSSGGVLIAASLVWGLSLLGLLSAAIAHERHVPIRREILRHYTIAIIVMAISRAIGAYVTMHVR